MGKLYVALSEAERAASLAQSVSAPPRFPASPPACDRCGFPLPDQGWGCKDPCPNCHTMYPLGDCSD